MRINAINSQITPLRRVSGKQVTNSVNNGGLTRNVISMSDYMAARTVSFGKKDAKQDQVIFIGAESAPWSKKGGVGTVMQDYRDFGSPKNQIEITPYYKAGKDDSDNTIPLQDDNGYYMKDSGDKEIRLVKVAEKEMQWGKLTDEKIMLFKKQSAEGENACPSYFVFVDDVSNMKVPYESGHNYRSGAKAPNNGWNGDPYAKYSKAAVELLPDIIADVNKGRAQDDEFNPATIVCSDSQTAYVYEYMAQHAEKDKNNDQSAYYGIHPTYVGHNLGPGYCGETSMRNMFVNLGATPEQIKKIEEDLMFQQNILGDKYFEPLVKEALDANGNASAVMIPIHYTQKGENATANGEGYGKMFTVVAEDYAESLATNPQAANNIYPFVNKMREQGVFDGILNPLNDPKLNPTKPVPNAPYTKELTEEIDGKTVTYPAFEVYPENPTYEQMRQVKNTNKARLLRRLSAHNTDIIGPKINGINSEDENKTYPLIREDLIQKIENGEGDDVPVFVSWGRCDTQKGHDITLNAFKEFAKTPEGKNAILLLGAGLEKGNPESQKIEETVAEMLKDEDLKGRIVHIDGWAPGYAFASAADYAIFASRFEPCGLTDLEAMKYYCTPIVTNTQGFKQKNFDPRIDAEKHKATSLRTQHEYNLLAKEHIQPIIDGYVSGNKAATAKVKKEFPLFKDANGKYDDKLFK
ncbi:glycosyltransferase, partial [bacterium]|nr:glycosyltransferase [bacterium]